MSPLTEWEGFDIETRGKPELVERYCSKFPAFDISAVKCGNLKDPEKIAAKLAGAEADHKEKEAAYWQKLKADAALNPITGEVVVIGLIDNLGQLEFLEGTERVILELFWFHFAKRANAARKFFFWSGSGAAEKNFDIDYILTRSRILGVDIPPIVRQGRYYSTRFQDLAAEFLLYQREQYMGLSRCADILGLYETPQARPIFRKRDDDPVRGENFAEFYEGRVPQMSAEESRKLALEYLSNDLLHLLYIAPRIL